MADNFEGEVIASEPGVREIPASEKFRAKRVDHYTVRDAGGGEYRVTAYRELGDAMPALGNAIRGELAGPDKWDTDRLKLRVSVDNGSAPGGSAPFAPPASPPASPPPAVAVASTLAPEELRRMFGFRCALEYLHAKAVLGTVPTGDFDAGDIRKLAIGFAAALQAPPAESTETPTLGDPLDLAPKGTEPVPWDPAAEDKPSE